MSGPDWSGPSSIRASRPETGLDVQRLFLAFFFAALFAGFLVGFLAGFLRAVRAGLFFFGGPFFTPGGSWQTTSMLFPSGSSTKFLTPLIVVGPSIAALATLGLAGLGDRRRTPRWPSPKTMAAIRDLG